MLTDLQAKWISSVVTSLVAGLVAIGASLAIEKLGGLLGGVLVFVFGFFQVSSSDPIFLIRIIANSFRFIVIVAFSSSSSPTTIVPSVLGLTLAGATDEAIFLFAFNFPPAMLLNSWVLLVWKLVSERLPTTWAPLTRLGTLVAAVLVFWFVAAAGVVLGLERGLQIPALYLAISSIIIHALCGAAVLLLSPSAAPKGKNPVSTIVVALRGICAASAIFIGSIIARDHPSIGGFISCFPAIYLITLISVHIAQGAQVASGATGSMILGGVAVSVFAISYSLLYPIFGWISAAIMAYLIAVLGWSVPLGFFLKWWNTRKSLPSSNPADSLNLDTLSDDSSTNSPSAITPSQTPTNLSQQKSEAHNQNGSAHPDFHDDDDEDPNIVKLDFSHMFSES